MAANLKTLSQKLQDLENGTVQAPLELPFPGHQFGLRFMNWAIALAKLTGLRAAPEVVRVTCHYMGIDLKIPDWTTLRSWIIRAGIGCLEEPVEVADDWVWIIDHSNQIGQEKVFVVLGMRLSKAPPLGTPLKHSDLRVLEVLPGTSWKTEDVGKAFL
jgi:hypothetical protein